MISGKGVHMYKGVVEGGSSEPIWICYCMLYQKYSVAEQML